MRKSFREGDGAGSHGFNAQEFSPRVQDPTADMHQAWAEARKGADDLALLEAHVNGPGFAVHFDDGGGDARNRDWAGINSHGKP